MMLRRLAAALALVAICPSLAAERDRIDERFDEREVALILRQGPWPPAAARDPSNRVSGNAQAIGLGRALFFERRLSPGGAISCARCHAPEKSWVDGRAQAAGIGELERNTPSLWNARLNRWFGWDGGSDSLWSFIIRPILHPAEMGADAKHVAAALRADPQLACLYESAFGKPGRRDAAIDEQVLVNAAKALAAFVETLGSGRTPFDEFRDALARDDALAAARYPDDAQRGLKIFIGKGNCSICHFGANFSNSEFHDVGVPFFVKGGADPGRHGGIQRLRADPFNLLGRYNDDPSGEAATKTRYLDAQHRNFGEFKTPSLRNVELSPPYMHNGRLASLRDVVLHYSGISPDRLHSDGEALLKPLDLSDAEVDDLVAFLRSLTDPQAVSRAKAIIASRPIRCAAPTSR
jgi:cytochrome c peroxidase